MPNYTTTRREKGGHLQSGIRMPGWDYAKPWIYMITLTVKDRRPILGRIDRGLMIPSPLGERVAKAWKNLATVFSGVEACQYAVMPEHFHGIVWLHRQGGLPLGGIVRAFKAACTKANAESDDPFLFDGNPAFWFPDFHDTILFSKGQLKRMMGYILRNAERRWAVLQNPELFKITRGLAIEGLPFATSCIGGRSGAVHAPPPTLDAIGNRFLLDSPIKQLVQVSRHATIDEMRRRIDEALLFGRRGGVAVSGCISPGEQAVARAVREAGYRLIAIVPRGFGPYFKPKGAYFDACVSGNLLMISPFAPIDRSEPLTRARCLEINALAAGICGCDPSSIQYRGGQCTRFS